MRLHLWRAALAALLAFVGLAIGSPANAAQGDGQRCFQETGMCIAGRIRSFWEHNGGLSVFGLPIASQQGQAQWFERARIELHPDKAQPYDVELGRLGADRLGQQGQNWFAFPKSEARNGCRFFSETGHNVCGEILASWRASGLEFDGRRGTSERESMALFGLPLSDARAESMAGKERTVQWFERARFELHPENARPHHVQLGLLGSESQAGPHGTIWVANRMLNNVVALDAASGEVIATIAVGRGSLSIVGDGANKLYVANEGANSVSVIDRRSMKVVANIPTGPMPHHISASPNGRFVYVGEYGTNKVGVIDTKSDTLVAEYVTGPPEARTHAVSVTRDGKTLLATNDIANTVVALDANTGAIKWTLNVGAFPDEALADTAGKLLYVSARGASKLLVVDMATQAILHEVPTPAQPVTLQLSPDGKQLSVALRSSPAGMVLMDTDTLAITPVSLPGTVAGHNWLSPDGHYSFVAVEGPSAGVAVVDNRDGSVVALHPYPGGGRPHGIYVEPGQTQP
ncbi:MAG TPA: beta-propeller fold lactonase family protein [Roseiflexaceae bacterium]|nr:beta-propeller fold lactonase family protein [Roseiflexaceae bacterium]